MKFRFWGESTKRDDGGGRRRGRGGGITNLVVLQQDEAEIELAEGELQVLDVVVLAALLLRQVEHGLALPQAGRGVALALRVQRRLKLVLQRGEASLGFGKFLYKRERGQQHDVQAREHGSAFDPPLLGNLAVLSERVVFLASLL